MKIEQEHWDNAARIKDITGGIVAGSVHVSIENANDIDIVVSHEKWNQFCRDFSVKDFGLVRTDIENDATYEIEAYELIEVWSLGKVNILVYNPDFIPAIKAAIRDMKRSPMRYDTREKRIDLHQKYKQIIRDMLDKDYEPPVAFQEK